MIDQPPLRLRARWLLAAALVLLVPGIVFVPAARDPIERTSLYLTMRDGVRIAVDVHLPTDRRQGERLPTILRQTRYFRSVAYRWPWGHWLDRPSPLLRRFVGAGYAWVDVDVRGSGASFGSRPYPWSEEEVRDGAEVVDWIVAQDWSNGRVGATGVSYDGTAAEMLLRNHHPAVRAVAPRFSLFDVYADVAFPGGLHLRWFTETWGRFNRALDSNRLRDAIAWWVPLFARGVRPVDSDSDERLLERAVRAHADNYDPDQEALSIAFRDELSSSGTATDRFSPHSWAPHVAASRVPIYSYSGWLDGAYARAAIERFRTVRTQGSRLRLGPWNHGGDQNISPWAPQRRAEFDHAAELIRFFDAHLKGAEVSALQDDRAEAVAYYTIGEERWKTASTWPPPGRRVSLFLSGGSALRGEPSEASRASDRYVVDPTTGTGPLSRWNSLMGDVGPVGYPDRASQDERLLVYDSEPFEWAIEVTGEPRVELWVSSPAEDAALFVYLEDVDADGRVHYVTEGAMRALHRAHDLEAGPSFRRADAAPLTPGEPARIGIEMLPISWRFAAGHSIRLAIAGADADHFAPLSVSTPQLTVHRDRSHPSRLDLPVVSGLSAGQARRYPAR